MHVCVPRWEDPKLPTNSRRIEENVLLYSKGWVKGKKRGRKMVGLVEEVKGQR